MAGRRSGSLALALLLLTAGCGGFAPGAGDGGTGLTPAPVPTAGEAYPPGIGASGVVDPQTLARAHERTLENASYRLHSNRSTYFTNGSVRSRIDLTLHLSRDRHHRAVVRTAGPHGPVILGRPPASAVYWSNRSLYASRLIRGDRTLYSVTSDASAPVATWSYWAGTAAFGGESSYAAARYAGFFRDIPTTVAGSRTRNGTTYYRLRGRGTEATAFAADPVDAVGPAGPGPMLRATVSEDGLVRSLHLRYRAFDDGAEYTVDWRVRYRQVRNVTVTEPAWLDRALE
ncbi:hypothetical protein BRC89_10935 [Halobacteriales archaeon QS_4_70_19]|nr:MAG: hypothetical protein BRC89_10935 [Halobacteriales archaeon QS_4_70_19]